MTPRTLFLALLALAVSLLGLTAGVRAADASTPTAAKQAAKDNIPRTYDEAVQHFKNHNSGQMKVRRFLMPSGNIYCTIKVSGMPKACEINEGAVKDPDACGNNPASQYVGRIEFHNGRATPVCNTDTIRQPGAKTLPYGMKARYRKAKIKCLSETIGVTCIHLTKTEGFFLHKGEYVIFNAG